MLDYLIDKHSHRLENCKNIVKDLKDNDRLKTVYKERAQEEELLLEALQVLKRSKKKCERKEENER